MPSKTVKLSTNLPVIGTVSKALFHHNEKAIKEGWDPQLKLVGTWDEEGEGNLYLPLRLAGEMHKAGFITIETGPDHDLYKVMMPLTKIKLLKEEDGTKKFIRFSFAEHPALSYGDPEKGGDPGQNGPQGSQVTPRATKSTPKGKEPLKDTVGAVKRFHLGCMALSAHNHVLLYTCPTESLDMNAVHAGGFTIMKMLTDAGVTGFSEEYVKRIRDTLGTASHDARKTSNQDWPKQTNEDLEEES